MIQLDALLDERFVLVHMTGMRQDKHSFIQAVLGGALNYYSCVDDGVDIALNGDSARLIGRSRVQAAVFGGRKRVWRLRQEMTLIKQNGFWRATSSKASTY